MPPNFGGFFMVRSYYPSECHADYFDFERIEALKPAIEACGISTLSQSPMLGFISRWITASSSWKRFCHLVCRLLLEKKKTFIMQSLGCTSLQTTWNSLLRIVARDAQQATSTCTNCIARPLNS